MWPLPVESFSDVGRLPGRVLPVPSCVIGVSHSIWWRERRSLAGQTGHEDLRGFSVGDLHIGAVAKERNTFD